MKKNNLANRLLLAAVFLFLYAPIFVLIFFSFNATKSRTIWGGFSLQWYVRLFQDSAILSALQTTLLVSVLASLIAMNFRNRFGALTRSILFIPVVTLIVVFSVQRKKKRRRKAAAAAAPAPAPEENSK